MEAFDVDIQKQNIKMYLKEEGYSGVKYIHVAQDRQKWRTV
jgi:hypothetical protein